MDLLRDNPVLVRELRVRMRGARPFWLMLLYVAVAATVVALCVGVFAAPQFHPYGIQPRGEQLGRSLATALMAAQGALICLCAPGIAAASISAERERLTYALVRVTLLRAIEIVAGKFVSSLSYMALLMLSMTPFAALVFLYGGVSAGQLALGYVIVLVGGLYFGSAGLWWSASCRRTAASAVGAYGTMLLFAAGGPAAGGFIWFTIYMRYGQTIAWVDELKLLLMQLNPAVHAAMVVNPDPSVQHWFAGRWPVISACFLVLTAVTILFTTLRVRQQTE